MILRLLILAAICSLPCTLTRAADAPVTVPSFKALESRSIASVNLTVGPWMLHMAGAMMDDKNEQDAAFHRLLAGIRSIQVRSFTFADDFAYPTAEIDTMRRQLAAPAWAKIVQVHDRQSHEEVEVYVALDDDRTRGLTLIASDPRQLTVINIVGTVELKDLPALEEHLHVPTARFPSVAMR